MLQRLVGTLHCPLLRAVCKGKVYETPQHVKLHLLFVYVSRRFAACPPYIFMSGWTTRSIPLPPELLTYIFDLATYNPVREIDTLIETQPFEGEYSTDVDALCDAPLETKRTIAMTCSLFRQLSAKFLFEDVRVRHGSEGLADALERDPGLGLFVKRISISLDGFKAVGHWCASLPAGTKRILQRCPNVLILTRPQHLPVDTEDSQEEVAFGFPMQPSNVENLDDIHLPQLRRIDWFNSPVDSLPSTIPTPKFIWISGTLQTLTIGPDHFPIQTDVSPIVDLPNLRTIRLRSLHTPGNVGEGGIEPEAVKLPTLERLIFTQPDGIYTLFFHQFLRANGPKITTVEFAPHRRFLLHDFISVVLLNCSNATTLNFPVFTTKPTRKNTRRQHVQVIYLITHVGLSAHGLREEAEDVGEEDGQWARMAGHFLSLFGERTRFSKLEKLTLFGEEWEWILSDARFRGILKLVRSRNVEIVCEHESVAATLETSSKGLNFWLTSSC